jgi:hypothetical protein
MSADNKLDLSVVTEHGPVHSMVRYWNAKVREQPAVRVSREVVIGALQDDPNMKEAVEAIKANIPKGSVVWIVSAESTAKNNQAVVELSVRFG